MSRASRALTMTIVIGHRIVTTFYMFWRRNHYQKNLYDVFQQAKADNKTANVAAIMDTWILQMGYPVVTVTRNLDAGTAQVTQSRFLLNPGQKPSTIYTSPFSYVFQVFLRGLESVTDCTLAVLWVCQLLGSFTEAS